MEPAFSDAYGFSGANCWWVATISELITQPSRWLHILYLAFNYGCLDARDIIYGLRGLMTLRKDSHVLDPDYSKSALEVYRNSVEAALGKGINNALPLAQPLLKSVATSLSFGLNHRISPSEQLELLHNFVAYLGIVFADDPVTLATYIPQDVLDDSLGAGGRAFGKPVWDFQYPESSIFVTKNRLVGCAIATTQLDDEIFVAMGGTYPMVLRPSSEENSRRYAIRGFAYVDGVMNGERAGADITTFDLK